MLLLLLELISLGEHRIVDKEIRRKVILSSYI
jgi:hypothetical protein